jgi:hypothetical protein
MYHSYSNSERDRSVNLFNIQFRSYVMKTVTFQNLRQQLLKLKFRFLPVSSPYGICCGKNRTGPNIQLLLPFCLVNMSPPVIETYSSIIQRIKNRTTCGRRSTGTILPCCKKLNRTRTSRWHMLPLVHSVLVLCPFVLRRFALRPLPYYTTSSFSLSHFQFNAHCLAALLLSDKRVIFVLCLLVYTQFFRKATRA